MRVVLTKISMPRTVYKYIMAGLMTQGMYVDGIP